MYTRISLTPEQLKEERKHQPKVWGNNGIKTAQVVNRLTHPVMDAPSDAMFPDEGDVVQAVRLLKSNFNCRPR